MKRFLTGMLTLALITSLSLFAEAKKKSPKKVQKVPKRKVYLIKRKALPVLTLQQVASLETNQRIHYIHQLRRAYDLAEKIQGRLATSKKSKKGAQIPGYDNELWALLLGNEAYAADYKDTCISHGRLISGVNCNIKQTPYYHKNKQTGLETVTCGPATGLRGIYAEIPYSDNSPNHISYSSHATYATCGGVAKVLQYALKRDQPIVSQSIEVNGTKVLLRATTRQLEADRQRYHEIIKQYETELKKYVGQPLTTEQVDKRTAILSKIKDLVVLPEVEAHVIKLLADTKYIKGYYPSNFEEVKDMVKNPTEFDREALLQETILLLSSGQIASVASLKKLGIPEEKAQKIQDQMSRLKTDEDRRELGLKILKQAGINPDQGFYRSFDKRANQIDGQYAEILKRCIAPTIAKPEQAFNSIHTIGCDKNNPRYKECVQYLECAFSFEESGGQLSDGRFKDVMDAYMNMKLSMYNICQSLPPGRENLYPMCVLDNSPEEKPNNNYVVVAPPPPEVFQKYWERREDFGCRRERPWDRTELLMNTRAACAMCSLEKDAENEIRRISNYKDFRDSAREKYMRSGGISQKWMVLSDIMVKTCGQETASKYMNVDDYMQYAQIFGHCAAGSYDWDQVPYGEDWELITLFQDRDFENKSPENLSAVKSLGWSPDKESYEDFINRKFKEYFGFHFQQAKKEKSGNKSSDSGNSDYDYFYGSSSGSKKSSGGKNNRPGLREMFCGSDNKKRRRSAGEILQKVLPNYETILRSQGDTGMDPHLKTCMQEGLNFAKNNYHLSIKRGQACYERTTLKPLTGEVEARAPIIISQDQYRCGWSTYINHNVQPEAIEFHEPWSSQRDRTKSFAIMDTAKNEYDRNCNGQCDSSSEETDFILQNQCLVDELRAVEHDPKKKTQKGRQTK
ncbi:MAG: hypothetical protein KDD40_01510 [Bdellovibrionales bacterium]|nr:hypothetical protein [Bdellovibrionales bacterium]